MELSIGNETHSLTLCANMAGFGKAGHILDLEMLLYNINLCDKNLHVGHTRYTKNNKNLKLATSVCRKLTHLATLVAAV